MGRLFDRQHNIIKRCIRNFVSDNEESKKPYRFWNNLNHQRKFFEEVAKKLNIKTKDDWYRINSEDLHSAGAQGVLLHYKNSLYDALRNLYPEHWYSYYCATSRMLSQLGPITVPKTFKRILE